MCGIVGFQGDYSAELLQRMTDTVAHRGPDGEGIVTFELLGQAPTGLGHRRLAIIDLSDAGLQPMSLDGGQRIRPDDVTLSFNGEIYNYRELRDVLMARGHRFRTASDSEVLLHLYQEYGTAMLTRLNGIFAFAIHDGREWGRPEGVERGALFVARDHLGVKPMYYTESRRGFLFGSEIKALLAEPGVDRTIDDAALHQTLAHLWTPSPRTILKSVRKLPPGTAMIVSGGKVRSLWSYYTLPYDGSTVRKPEAELARELAERVYTAVDRQLVSDVPVGAFLSGGLDSSSVVAMMRRARPAQEINAFTIGFEDDGDTDGNPQDIPFARRVARQLDLKLQEITLPASAIHRVGEVVRLLDEPQADPAPINALMIAEASRALGIPVLLSGAGGDDIFGGYRRHWAVQFERTWSWLPLGARAGLQGAARWAASGHGSGQSVPALRRLAKMLSYAAETPDRRLVSYFLWGTDQLRRGLYTPEFRYRVAREDASAPLLESLTRIPNEHDPLQRMLFLEGLHFLADHNLNYTDRAGMAVAVEVRVPLLDPDLVAFAAHLPPGMKQAGRVGKPLFKKAMEPYLPHDVIYRPKTGFGAPLRRWLRTELRELVSDTLSPDALRRRGYFEPAAVARLIDQNRRGVLDGSYTIFALLTFELWCRSFLDSAPTYTATTSSCAV